MESSQKGPPKPRKVKPLPQCLLSITDKDRDMFLYQLEVDDTTKSKTYGKEVKVAKYIELSTPFHDKFGKECSKFDLATLTSDQIRALAKQLGIKNVGSTNKFDCRKQIANYLLYQKEIEMGGLKPKSNWARVTSTVCRAVNVVFSSQFFVDFLAVNDIKNRKDHESANTNKAFWIRAADAYNCINLDIEEESDDGLSLSPSDDLDRETEGMDFTKLVHDGTDVHLVELENDPDINLSVVDHLHTDAFKKRILTLFKIRRTMQKNMTQSGTHDSDAWNFIEVAMRTHSGVTVDAVYYFWTLCESHSDIDASFQPFMPGNLKGSSFDDPFEEEDSPSALTSASASVKKRKIDEYLPQLAASSQAMVGLLKSAEIDRHIMMEQKEKEREERRKEREKQDAKDNFKQQVDLAKALGDTEELKRLMDIVKNNK